MKSLSHIAVKWLQSNPDYPIELYSELDAERGEVRTVEVFADGRAQFADATSQIGDTLLSESPIPPLDEIARDPQFVPRIITAAEFEWVWNAAYTSSR